MNLGNPVETLAGLPVHDYNPAEGIDDAAERAYRIAPVQIYSLHLDLFGSRRLPQGLSRRGGARARRRRLGLARR
jgi:hypothetical protein